MSERKKGRCVIIRSGDIEYRNKHRICANITENAWKKRVWALPTGGVFVFVY